MSAICLKTVSYTHLDVYKRQAPWRAFGLCLGEAYQVADDVRDVVATSQLLGKPAGRDRALSRPSSAAELGLCGAIEYFDRLVERSIEAIPELSLIHI